MDRVAGAAKLVVGRPPVSLTRSSARSQRRCVREFWCMIPHVTCLHQRCLFHCAHRHALDEDNRTGHCQRADEPSDRHKLVRGFAWSMRMLFGDLFPRRLLLTFLLALACLFTLSHSVRHPALSVLSLVTTHAFSSRSTARTASSSSPLRYAHELIFCWLPSVAVRSCVCGGRTQYVRRTGRGTSAMCECVRKKSSLACAAARS